MNKKLQLFTKVSFILLGILMLNSCEGEKYYPVEEIYYNDPSANWKIEYITVGNQGSNAQNKWVWDGDSKTYRCVIPLPELYDVVYDDGVILAYTFFGEYEYNETQYILPFHKNGANITYEVSYDLDSTICFFIKRDDGEQIAPGEFIFKVVLLWRDPTQS